jgi:hypothetical protein
MHTKKILAIVVSFFLLAPVSAQAATVNKACSKAGQTTGSGSMKLTCKKVSGKLKWVSTPAVSKPAKSTPTPAAPKVGSFSSPVPVGTFATIGDFKYRLDSSANDITAAVCESNGFNTGCTYDSNFNRIIDPKATGRWISISVTAVNTGQEIARPAGYATSFELVLPNGKLQSNDSTGIDGDLDAVSLIPGGQATGVITFYLEKNVMIPDLIVLRDRVSFTNSATVYYSVPK